MNEFEYNLQKLQERGQLTIGQVKVLRAAVSIETSGGRNHCVHAEYIKTSLQVATEIPSRAPVRLAFLFSRLADRAKDLS